MNTYLIRGPCLTLEKLAMKKSLIALAVLTASGISFAQSSVTLFGVVDAAYTYGKSDANKVSSMSGSGSSASSRLGFRGEEDLGGGMKAGFWLEAGVNVDSGIGQGNNTNNQSTGQVAATTTLGSQGLNFNRRSTVSLMGGFGEVRLGRDYTPTFWSQTAYDPFGTVGVGASQANAGANPASNWDGVRASNSIGYLSPTFNGLALWAQTHMGENQSNAAAGKKTGGGSGLRVTYASGPLSLAVATAANDTGVGTTRKNTNVAGSYDLGIAKLMALSSVEKITGSSDVKGYLLGATAPLGSGTLKFSYTESKQDANKANKTAIGYVYGLSKRTNLYTTLASVKNSGTSAVSLGGTTGVAGQSSTGMDFGVTHSF